VACITEKQNLTALVVSYKEKIRQLRQTTIAPPPASMLPFFQEIINKVENHQTTMNSNIVAKLANCNGKDWQDTTRRLLAACLPGVDLAAKNYEMLHSTESDLLEEIY
ncbi:unnamed protein product, partial [Didymodactylos carnosus]